MNVPDYISPVVGFRVWQWDATGLRSLNGEKWFAHQPLSAVCRADACGSISGLSKATHNPDELPCFKCTCGVRFVEVLMLRNPVHPSQRERIANTGRMR